MDYWEQPVVGVAPEALALALAMAMARQFSPIRIRSRSRSAHCCRCAWTSCSRHARTSPRRASPMAPSANTPPSGSVDEASARWPPLRWRGACRRASCAVRADPGLLADFQRTLEGQGVLLTWPSFGALTPTHRHRLRQRCALRRRQTHSRSAAWKRGGGSRRVDVVHRAGSNDSRRLDPAPFIQSGPRRRSPHAAQACTPCGRALDRYGQHV